MLKGCNIRKIKNQCLRVTLLPWHRLTTVPVTASSHHHVLTDRWKADGLSTVDRGTGSSCKLPQLPGPEAHIPFSSYPRRTFEISRHHRSESLGTPVSLGTRDLYRKSVVEAAEGTTNIWTFGHGLYTTLWELTTVGYTA